MGRRFRVLQIVISIIALLAIESVLYASGNRVLIVTTEQYNNPTMWLGHCGAYVATDLAAAGYPFDVVTYGRFVNMPLDPYDVIILNGHTSPTPIPDVASKCQAAFAEGRKIFSNGDWPTRCYSPNGSLIQRSNYIVGLFNAVDTGTYKISGPMSVPKSIEKDPFITAYPIPDGTYLRVYRLNTPASMSITVQDRVVGFLTPQGGMIDSSIDFMLQIVDYGKIVSYLRFGKASILGFANDRIEGKPIASFEVHCDYTSDLAAIDELNKMAIELNLPLINLLVFSYLNQNSKAKWNAVSSANPLMAIGSHTRTHPADWPSFPNYMGETRDAIADQSLVIPATRNYFNFSGSMNPTTQQIDQLENAGVTYGAGGTELRNWKLSNGDRVNVQRTPTRLGWFRNLSQSTVTPYCLSTTVDSDYPTWRAGSNYFEEVKSCFENNVKYGLYTYGYFHDYMMNPGNSQFYIGGIHMSQQIRAAMQYLKSQDVKFIYTDDLIHRLRDFVAGRIEVTEQTDGSLSVSVYRPQGKVNQVKIQSRDGEMPAASGESVVSQTVVGDILYVDLRPEVTSVFSVRFTPAIPATPEVTVPAYTNGDISASWSVSGGTSLIAGYQYALGSLPGTADIMDWTSTSPNTSVNWTSLPLIHGCLYYVMVKAISIRDIASDVAVSTPILADLTPPTVTSVIDGDTQESTTELHAGWSATDLESGIVDYQYAVGTATGADDILSWMNAGSNTGLNITSLKLDPGKKYYISVRAKNGAGAWSDVLSSDGVLVTTDGKVSSAKRCYDGYIVGIHGAYITACYGDSIYVEQQDRSSGIKVEVSGTYSEGQVVGVVGEIRTVNGERVITRADIGAVSAGTPLRPVGIPPKFIGGTAFYSYNPGVYGGQGLNNVGLLVRTWGTVSSVGDTFFCVNDGSPVQTADGLTGIKVDAGTFTKPYVGEYVYITGVVSTEVANQITRPVIRLRSESDISYFYMYNTLYISGASDLVYVKPSQRVELALQQNQLTIGGAGYQVFLSYDKAKLAISETDVSLTSSPYGTVMCNVINPLEGSIDLSAGINVASVPPQMPTLTAAQLASLIFTPVSEGVTKVIFREHNPPTMLADIDGNALNTSTSDGPTIIIDGTLPSVNITHPNGGEQLRKGMMYGITWNASDANLAARPVKIEFLDGNNWTTIANNEANDGSFSWRVPMTTTQNARIRISMTDLAGNTGVDESDGFFRITN